MLIKLTNPFVAMSLMAVSVYLMRSSGYWLAGRFGVSNLLRTWLGYLPGCLMVSIVAPMLMQGSPIEWVGTLATGGMMILSDNLLISMVTGVVVVIFLRFIVAL
jgi:uncharacterized membrane protein